MRVGREMEDTSMRTDSGEGRRAPIYYAGGSGDNGMEEGINSREGGGVGPHILPYYYSFSPYCTSDPPLSQSVNLVPLLLHHPLKVGGVFRGMHNRKEALELRVNRSFISSCSSTSVHSLPCGPRIAEERESGFPAPSRFRSAGAGEYTRGAVVGAEVEERRA